MNLSKYYFLAKKTLFPINRSITGDGIKKTLKIITWFKLVLVAGRCPNKPAVTLKNTPLMLQWQTVIRQILDWTENKNYYKTTIIKWRGSSVG